MTASLFFSSVPEIGPRATFLANVLGYYVRRHIEKLVAPKVKIGPDFLYKDPVPCLVRYIKRCE